MKQPKTVQIVWRLFPKAYIWILMESMELGANVTKQRTDQKGK